jgi:hypothetical protein
VSKFDITCLLIVDALQRHTIEVLEEVSPEQAYTLSISRGAEWVERNSQLLSRLGLTGSLTYWSDLLKREDYPRHLERIEVAYHNSDALRRAVVMDVQAFTVRILRKFPHLCQDKLNNSCRNYVIEELAAQHPVNLSTGAVEVYPNVELYAAQAIRAGLVDSIESNFVATGFVRMSYRRVKPDTSLSVMPFKGRAVA